jgi:arylformamidase
MGHSAGAHLSALVGTDMQYLQKAKLKPNSLRGVIPLDGACYDVPRQIAQGGDFMNKSRGTANSELTYRLHSMHFIT